MYSILTHNKFVVYYNIKTGFQYFGNEKDVIDEYTHRQSRPIHTSTNTHNDWLSKNAETRSNQ